MKGERLIRVERFEELRAGMIVVVKDCDCGARHRGMVVRFIAGATGRNARGPIPHTVDAWLILPGTRCSSGVRIGYGIDAITVSDGVVFRVDDGLSLSTETFEQKRKPVRAS